MRIVHIVSTFPPYKGGMGMVAWQQARLLAYRGHEVTVFTPRYLGSTAHEIIDGVKIERLRPLVRYGNAAIVLNWRRRLADFDIVHLHYPFFGSAGAISRAALGRLVIQYHMDVLRHDWLALFFSWYAQHVTPLILARAQRVIVSSFDYAQSSALAPFFYPPLAKGRAREGMIELPLGVDTELFFQNETLRQAQGIIPTILFVGGLDRPHYFKGLSILFQTLRVLVDKNISVGLRVVGDGDLRAGYEAQARNLGITDHVQFIGSVSADDLPKQYAAADIFVLPSIDRSEAFGLVLLEAMCSSVPVIASDLPGVRTVVDQGITGFLVPPGDVTTLANRLQELLADSDKRTRMGRAGRERVMERYRWKKVVDALEAVYKNIS